LQEVVALQIMRSNYEQLVKAHQRAPQVPEDLVPDETKFQVQIGGFCSSKDCSAKCDTSDSWVPEDIVPDETKFQVHVL
jgi:hypothetical protein